MSEVDGPNKISINKVNFSGSIKQTPDVEQPAPKESANKIKDFSNAKAETIGRSMLFKGNDNINNDLKAIVEDPQIAENSDEVFETAYTAAQKAGMENPYEEAASASTTNF